MNNKGKLAIVPGSFDPITNGHIFVIKEAAKQYEKVVVAVMINSNKQYMFTLDERKEIVEAALDSVPNIEIVASEGWLYELANSLQADAIVKGYRNTVDFEYEQRMAEFNAEYAPNTKTILIKSDAAMENLSSTIIREKIINNQSLDEFLPKSAINAISYIISKRIK